jgi:hypothetical protein
VRAAKLALAALALAFCLAACETSAEKSAKLEKIAKQQAKRRATSQRGLSVTKLSTRLQVLATAIVSSSEGAVAVVMVRNSSATALRNAPIAITVRNHTDAVVYANNTPGLASALISIPLIPAHGELSWVDDQIPAGTGPGNVSARIGEGEPASRTTPRLSVAAVHLSDLGASEPEAEGRVLNESGIAQREILVYAVARRGGKIVAAGSALVPQLPTGPGTRFQLYFIGSLRGAQVQFSAVAAAA